MVVNNYRIPAPKRACTYKWISHVSGMFWNYFMFKYKCMHLFSKIKCMHTFRKLIAPLFSVTLSLTMIFQTTLSSTCVFIDSGLTLTLTLYSSSTSYVEYQAGGGKGLVDLVNQLTLERCHSFWFYGSCRKRIPIRDSSMPKRILSQCGVSSKMFIGLIVPTTGSSVRWD